MHLQRSLVGFPLQLVVALAWAMPLTPVQRVVVVAFAAMPTASSCHVLAMRLGGDASFVSGLVTLSPLLVMLGIPAALAVLGWMLPG